MPVTIPFEKRWVRWCAGFLFWTLVVLFYSTTTSRRGQPVPWIEVLQGSMSRWYVWGLLAPLIIWADRSLPVAREALGRRVLCHIPLSFLFTYVYLYASGWASAVLGVDRMGFSFSLDLIRSSWGGAFHWQILIYWLIIGVYGTYDYYNDLKQRQLKTVQLERLLAESRLDALRTQLHTRTSCSMRSTPSRPTSSGIPARLAGC